MNEPDPPVVTNAGADELLAALADDFASRQRGGEHPSVEEYAGRHPELAEQIRELFPAIIAMEEQGANATLEPPSERVGVVIGRYKLLERIGEGGFGVVYMAEQHQPMRRRVALKVVKPGMDSRQVLARFEAERQALAIMDHSNIAKVFDGGMTDFGRPYFVMELVKGLPITEFCDRHQLPPRQRLELFAQVCHAVQHAHQKGIIHRDIKPSNVLVALHDATPVVKVIDFGVAKALAQEFTEKTLFTGFAHLVGTPLYMSPEQAGHSALDVDTRSDIYSLGVMLYELLTGTTPFDKERFRRAAQDEIRRIIREEEPPRPSTRLSDSTASLPSVAAQRQTEPARLTKLVRGELDWIVMKALEKDRNRRYETANGLAMDVQRYLSDEAVLAVPPSAGYRLRKFVRKNKGPVVASSLVFLTLSLGIAGTTFGLIRAEEKRAEADQAKQRESERAEGERAAKKRAVEFRDQALDALRATTGTDVELLIGGKTELGANEKAYLEAIAKRWQAFAMQEGADEQSRAIQAEGHFRVGNLWRKLGRREEARSEYERAVDLWERLAADIPAVPDYRRELARSHNHVGLLLADLGKRAAAEEQYRKALVFQEKLAADFPAAADYRRDLATSHNSLGLLLTDLGKGTEAEEQFKRELVIQEKLAADFPTVPVYLRDLALSHNSLGILLAELGRRAEAEERFRKALVIQEKMTAEFPTVPVYWRELALSHNTLGQLLKELGKPAEAEEQCRKALVIQEKLAANFPAVPEYRRDLAMSHNNLGRLLKDLGKRGEAEEQHRKALVIKEKLAADFPTVPVYRRSLALSHSSLGILLADLGRRAEAEEQYRKAVVVQERLAAEFPAVAGYRIQLGGSYCNFGDVVLSGGRADESLGCFDKAIATLTPIHRAEPHDVTAKQFLRNSHWKRALAYDQLGRFADAAKDWDRTIELSPMTEQGYFRAPRAISQLQAGQVAEAMAEVAELTKSPNWNADQWYNFACAYAVASGKLADRKQEYADAAMELLHQAVRSGWRNASHMKTDASLDPIREREDFKKLLAGLENHK